MRTLCWMIIVFAVGAALLFLAQQLYRQSRENAEPLDIPVAPQSNTTYTASYWNGTHWVEAEP